MFECRRRKVQDLIDPHELCIVFKFLGLNLIFKQVTAFRRIKVIPVARLTCTSGDSITVGGS